MATKAPTKSKLPAKGAKVARGIRLQAPGPNGPTTGSIPPLGATVGGPDGAGKPADYPVSPGGATLTTYPIDLSQYVPKDARISCAWLVVTDNIVDLTKFKTIKVDQVNDTAVKLHLLLGSTVGRVAIRIHAAYVPV
jgi:hypothetical protein